jgi:hypothetical protein
MGSISFGCTLVAGRNRVPNPAAGMTAFFMGSIRSVRFNNGLEKGLLWFILWLIRHLLSAHPADVSNVSENALGVQFV